MYLYHFGIRELPFTLTPNTKFYFGLPSHNEALSVLKTALYSGEGFIKVTGEVGTGKTLICRKFLNDLPENFVAAYLPNPYLSPRELRHAVANELQVDLPNGGDQQAFTHAIQTQLIDYRKQGKAVVLIIDEAQALPTESIEALRLMTNLETETTKLMQVVLFGQPELDEKISRKELRQLRQRITFSYQLTQMTSDQIFQYINHRMLAAGYTRTPALFTKTLCRTLLHASKGTPRLVNVICHKALMLAYGEGKMVITKKHLKLAIADTASATPIRTARWLNWAIPAVSCLIIVTALMTHTDMTPSYESLTTLVSEWRQ